ncbi:unnamed protein product [Pelagomonas calceolata]|uniref:AB hydrolase-1 domain-containing protein n=1 Tax=Pelagomonas calceolata TaxID=35677 RepID=A0A7S3ZSH8_9STRA|nr:unnamed protein product [Pelagomonas calceolata]|mmetsp:Transcript_3710/g.11383  ORF Transcript_3710/g.11383 Transcript_3710/m.11383 type:complete len:609 (+) Transcript_3710:99-1925(+)
MMRFLCLISVCAALRTPAPLSKMTNAAQRTLANLPAVRTAVVDAAHRALDGCGVSVPVNDPSASPEAVKAQVGAVAATIKAKTHEVTKEALHELTDVVDHVRAATPSLRNLRGKKNNILKAPEERIQAEGHADVARAAMDAVLPASVALLALGAAGAAPWPAAAWALAEVCSRSYAFVVDDVGGKETVPPPSGNTRLLWRRCLENCDDVVSYVEGWFYGAQFDSLTRGDIEAWLSGNVFGAAASDHRQKRQLSWMVERLEERLSSDRQTSFVFPSGDATHEYMCAQQASAPSKHHPLLVYAIVDAAKNAQFLALKKRGFKRYSTGTSTYWRREAQEPVDGATPLIFAHGIGIGFLPYHNLIGDLVDGCESDGAPMYLLELPALALTRFGRELPSPKELGEAASRMLTEHDDPAACWVGHSFGTVAITYALKYAPSTVASCALIEPVCFHLHLPDVSRGFLFKETQDPILDILRTDPAISFSLRKRFWWQEAVLWVEDLRGRKCDVFLSSKDDIVPSASVVEYLKDTDVGVHNLGERGHGTWQYDADVAADVISKALALRRQPSEKRLSIKWPGDDVSIVDSLRSSLPDPEPFVDVMSRALYGDVYGAV